MSEFACEVVRVEIEEHPNADRLEVALIGGYKSIVMKGQFKSGDLAVYIPEQAIVPDELLKEMGLTGKLSGAGKNRVKATKLRGIVSQGLLYPANEDWEEGADVAETLGIVKFEPEVPLSLRGKVVAGPYQKWCFKFDIENLKKRPYLFETAEKVVMTEKVHGTFMVIGMLSRTAKFEFGVPSRFFVGSKGLFGKGITFDLNATVGNAYLHTVHQYGLIEKFNQFDLAMGGSEFPLYLFGEVYGFQDLKYGLGNGRLAYRAFDMARMLPDGTIDYVDDDMLEMALEEMKIERVPVLYKGPYSQEVVDLLTTGKETVTGTQCHMREGIVIKPLKERVHPRYGRVILKSVSSDYLLRKNGTEFN